MFGFLNKGVFAAIGALFLAAMYGIKRVFDARAESAKRADDAAGAKAAADKVNTDSRASSEVARETETKLNKEIANVEANSDADRAVVASGSLRVGSDAIQDAINRANGRL